MWSTSVLGLWLCTRLCGVPPRCCGAVLRHRGAAACRVTACWVTTGCRGWPRCGAAPPPCSGCARLRRCVRAVLALRSAGWCVAAVLGTVVCRSFPSLGFVGAPTILSHFSWWRSLFGSTSDEAWAGFQGRLRLVLERFVGPVRRVAHTNPHLPPRTLTNPHTRTLSQEHPFRNTSHTCTSVRPYMPLREPVARPTPKRNRSPDNRIDGLRLWEARADNSADARVVRLREQFTYCLAILWAQNQDLTGEHQL